MKTTDDALLQAITMPDPYAVSILRHLNRNVRPNWLTRLFPVLQAFQGVSSGELYVRLSRLEHGGLVWSEFGDCRYPERGNRRRRYYRLTEAGWERLRAFVGG